MFELFIGESKGLKEKYDNATQVICSICRHTCNEPTANLTKCQVKMEPTVLDEQFVCSHVKME